MAVSVVFIILLVQLGFSVGVIVDRENCTKSHFYCPDNCQLTWHNSCPYQCTCYPPRYCPAVKCPLPRPTCIIVTQTTINCPTCLCRTPVVTIKSTSKKANDTEFLYFEKKRFESKIRWLYPEDRSKCGARSMANVDQCLNGFLQDRQSIKDNFEPADGSFNPLISLHRQNLAKTCDSYDEALSCMGPALYDRCKNVHFELAKYDALFGYVCGPKRREYLIHHACLQELHRDSLKIKLCENLFFTSLLQLIQNTSLPVDQYIKQRCEIFLWMADCEKAAIQKFCSAKAAEVFTNFTLSILDDDEAICRNNITIKQNPFQDPNAPRKNRTTTASTDASSSSIVATDSTQVSETTVDSTFSIESSNVESATTVAGLEKSKEIATEPPISDLDFSIVTGDGVPTTTTIGDTTFPTEKQPFIILDVNSIDKKPHNSEEDNILIIRNDEPLSKNFTDPFDDPSLARQRLLNRTEENRIKKVSFTDATHIENNLIIDDPLIDKNEIFRPSNSSVAEKDDESCSFENRREINARFSYFLFELRDKAKEPGYSPVYPLIYSFPRDILSERCYQYKNAFDELPTAAKEECRFNYDVYDQVQNTYEAPCSSQKEANFRNYFDCLYDSKKNDTIQACEKQAIQFLKDPSLNMCDTYTLFVDCIYLSTVNLCGEDGWRSLYSIMGEWVTNIVDKKCILPYDLDGAKIL